MTTRKKSPTELRRLHEKLPPEERINNGPLKIDMDWESAIKQAFNVCPQRALPLDLSLPLVTRLEEMRDNQVFALKQTAKGSAKFDRSYAEARIATLNEAIEKLRGIAVA